MSIGDFNSSKCSVESITLTKDGVPDFDLACGFHETIHANFNPISITISHSQGDGGGGVDYIFKANVKWNNDAYTIVPESLEFNYDGGS